MEDIILTVMAFAPHGMMKKTFTTETLKARRNSRTLKNFLCASVVKIFLVFHV
jgi:L-cystine uptake protein TcyP (sodium:dicarboxylate symporter family)